MLVASSDDGRVKRALTMLPASAEGRVLDLSNATAIEAFFDAAGPLDHLVYTAGESLKLSALADGDIAGARRFFELRYWGAFMAARLGTPPDPNRRLDRVHIRRCGGKARTGVVCRGEYLRGDGGAGHEPWRWNWHRYASTSSPRASSRHRFGVSCRMKRGSSSMLPKLGACLWGMSPTRRRLPRAIST